MAAQTTPIPGLAQVNPPTGTSYAGNHSDIETPIDTTNKGVFFLNSHVTFDDIEDGSANTIFFGEHIQLAGDLGWASGTRSTLRNAGEPINFGKSSIMSSWGGSSPATSPSAEDKEAEEEVDADGNPKPNRKPPPDPVGGYSSYHPQGANFAFGDGTVRFLRTTINPNVFRQLSNRSDGQLQTGEQF